LGKRMKFWRITSPAQTSDYSHTWINGSLSHPDSMPGVKCDVCGDTWSGSRILPHLAPEAVQRRRAEDVWPIPLEQFDALREEAEAQIGSHGLRLLPGDSFQPAVLDVPSIPRADFLWGSLGSLVVSARVRDLFAEKAGAAVTMAKVKFGKIGKREALLPAPIPSTGEPDDLIAEARSPSDLSAVGPYYEVIPASESGWPPGGAPLSVCSGCLCPKVDNEKRQLVMRAVMWQGAPLFYLATTLWIIVSDDLKMQVEHLAPTNVAFESV
jgi:hypothetical protein